MEIPESVEELLNALWSGGYEAEAVGGCVRDALLGKIPHDWDVCTSALPEEVAACLPGRRILPTGVRHGTVTVVTGLGNVEITTYRTDGAYTDRRRPDGVKFVSSLREDAARRDFTINAMAYRPDAGVLDFFGGREDLQAGLIRCVGDPETRFREDALRILRALRFASQLGFVIEENTARAMKSCRDLLTALSAERVYGELARLLAGPGRAAVLRRYGSVLLPVLPELAPCLEDAAAWETALKAMESAGEDLPVRWALLLAPAGENGAEAALRRLKADRETRETVCLLLRESAPPPERAEVLRALARLGERDLFRLLEFRACQLSARPEEDAAREENRKTRELLRALLAEGACCDLRTLKVTGDDLRAMGFAPGPGLGRALNALLEEVVSGACPNERRALLARAGALCPELLK